MNPKFLYYENKAYEKWIKEKPCIICGSEEVQGHHDRHARGNSFLLLPLCVSHHMPGFPDSYHQIEREAFEEKHAVNLDWIEMGFLMEFINKEMN